MRKLKMEQWIKLFGTGAERGISVDVISSKKKLESKISYVL